MKDKTVLLLLILVALFLNACNTKNQKAKDNDTVPVEDLYFDQKTPGLTPKVFVPNSISKNGWELGGEFDPDTEEFYFVNPENTSFDPTVIVFRKEGNA